MKSTCLILFLSGLLSHAIASPKPFYGLNYGINRNDCPNLETVRSDFRALSKYTNTIRIYSLKDCNMGQTALQAAQENNLRLYLGMWVDKTDSFDLEYVALNRLVSSSQNLNSVEAIIVGSEVLYRNDSSSEELSKQIKKVKTLVKPKGIKVTTSEVYYKFTPAVVDTIDFLMMNAFIYWEGEQIEGAANKLYEHFISAKELSKGKTVRISETGWPEKGDTFKNSIPSPENQKTFLLTTLCKAKQYNMDIIWFSAIDEPYKSGVESHFGLLNLNRQLKSFLNFNQLMNPC
ncbi:glycoside hydrolase superfamily [Gilbertella persicaria]|uniref:glucan endo-1,3-beta-D-glucosidase n=1 Tax=Rhizopus stolonifer TaxID=4846 RepID=A0A367K7S2_RHIST|nr:glycoside hydrolase superfamily [Gilbertella persicaria]KAI8061495.1 glycoside hydrolase superfamily [Gilbertella persicaria]RCH98225.1 glycoside hydrolase 3 protein [Rhizopus stolonifer]